MEALFERLTPEGGQDWIGTVGLHPMHCPVMQYLADYSHCLAVFVRDFEHNP
jgi:hypothetical protein